MDAITLLTEVVEHACHCDEGRCVRLRTEAIDSLLDRLLIERGMHIHGEQ
ncbi:hypothetical protein [Enterococcus hirae]|nr:hypothetical protein [Enterococcus hirae]NAE18040.1 hypothetical protein [Enterococcus hirae]